MQGEERPVLTSKDGEGEGPHVYQVRRDLNRWNFSRRDFLAAAGTSAAAVAAGTLAGCEAPTPEVITQVVTSGPPGVITRVVTPGPPVSPFAAGDLTPEELLAACGELKAHEDEIDALAVTPDGRLLVSGGKDGTIKLWSLPERALIGVVKDVQEPVYDLAVSPDGGHMAVARSGTVEWRSLPEGNLVEVLDLPRNDFTALALSSDGQLLAAATTGPGIYVWSLARRGQVAVLTGQGAYVASLAMTPDGSLLISGADDGRIGLWSLPDGTLLTFLASHSGLIGGLAVHPSGTMVASGAADQEIHLWSLPDGDLLAELGGHEDVITDLAITRDGSVLVSCSLDKTVRLWSLPGGESLGVLRPGGEIYGVDVGPDGTWLASASRNGTLKIWSLPGGEFAACAIDPDANSDDVEVVTYEVVIESGERVEYTQPVGIAIPVGVVCTCNTVSGGVPSCSCVGHSVPSGGHYWYPC
jgi:hypothetical protein